ncbi:unnamed protein product [Spirodela intermedia]|uniref:Trehalose 6-phosphate phosphatase n=1 Tax=Spirodela intermedia TaxID=51605 RepID=A0A7I8II51_SPIIN|nr:unnamed protein product [Spirodela intermedia]CAA6656835.1 unnamed protein product [Spirodela intermedia]
MLRCCLVLPNIWSLFTRWTHRPRLHDHSPSSPSSSPGGRTNRTLPLKQDTTASMHSIQISADSSNIGGAPNSGRIIASLESMRASSPTHLKAPTALLTDDDDRLSWMRDHPSALNMFEEIVGMSKGKQIAMFLDYDGTLSPSSTTRVLPTAIVRGRCKDKVFGFVQLAELYYAGSHGMDIQGPEASIGTKCTRGSKSVLFQPASEFLLMIDEVYKALVEKTKAIPGAKVENNRFCVSVHFRCVDEKRWVGLAEQVGSVLKGYPKLRVTQGRKVLEIRSSIKWDKGKALEFLLDSLGFADSEDVLPVYIGDDRTDEDAFKREDRGSIPKDTSASYSLREPLEVMEFLKRVFARVRCATPPPPNMRELILSYF